MKIAQLFGVKPNRQPRRCCHRHDDGTECKAHACTGKQYCFFHDPEAEEKRAAARRAGGVIRSRQNQDQQNEAQAILELPPSLLARPLQQASDVTEFLNETIRQFCQGKIDLRTVAALRSLALALLRSLELEERTQRQASLQASRPAKKQPEDLNLVLRDITAAQIAPEPDTKPSAEEDEPDQDPQPAIIATPAASVQTKAPQQAKALQQATAQAKAQTKAPQPDQPNQPQPNHSAASPALTTPRHIAPAPKENPPVHYPPGLGPRYLGYPIAAAPSMTWWRRQSINPAYRTGTAAQTVKIKSQPSASEQQDGLASLSPGPSNSADPRVFGGKERDHDGD